MTKVKQKLLIAAVIGMAASASADWNPGDPAKWVQMPDLQNGMDVYDTFSPLLPYNKILADDFKCTQTGPITSIHIWGSWLNDRAPRDASGTPIPPVFGLLRQPAWTGSSCAPRSPNGHRNWSRSSSRRLGAVTYIIAEPCIDIKDLSCVDVCPVDCIHTFDRMLIIDPEECIDCGACEPECPVEAIFPEDALPEKWEPFVKINYAYGEGADVINQLVNEYATEHDVQNPPLETS